MKLTRVLRELFELLNSAKIKYLGGGRTRSGVPWRMSMAYRVNFIGKQPLLKNKRATGRVQDIADAEKLEVRAGSGRLPHFSISNKGRYVRKGDCAPDRAI